MDWLQLVLLPIAGLLGGWIADRRSKKNTSSVVEVSKLEAATSARNAASTEFQMITQGFSTRYTQMQEEITALQTQTNALMKQNKEQAEDNARLSHILDEVLDYLAVVEALVPADRRPDRPRKDWRDS